MSIEKTLHEIHDTLAKKLLAKIEAGEATAADFAVARQFLKDNGVTSVPTPGQNSIGDLALPFSPDDDDPDYVN